MKTRLLYLLLLLPVCALGQIEEVAELQEIRSLDFDFRFKFDGRLFFQSLQPRELWVTDGTTDGTKRVEGGTEVDDYYLVNDRCLVTRNNSLYEIKPGSTELDLITIAAGSIRTVSWFDGKFLLLLNLTDGTSYLQSIDPEQGTVEAFIYQADGSIDAVVQLDEGILFSYDNNLLYSDGTAAGTITLLDSQADGILDIGLLEGTSLNGRYYFPLRTAAYGTEPWITDGSINGTRLLQDIFPGTNDTGFVLGSFPTNFFRLNDEVYFFAFTEGYDFSLFKTSGSGEGPELLFSLEEAFDFIHLNKMFFFKEEVYLEISTGNNGYELWKTDGTLAGTRIVKDIWPGSGGSSSSGGLRRLTTPTGHYIYFNANDGTYGYELWRSDGTEKGTGMISDFSPGADWSTTIPLNVLGDHFYFVSIDKDRNYRLYSFDQSAPPPEIPAYSPSYDWFETIGYNYTPSLGAPFLYNDEMETDTEGNVYLAGEFSELYLQFYGSPDFIRWAPTGEGFFRNFLASYSNSGAFRWAMEVGGYSFGKEQAIATDAEDHVICGGVYNSEGVIGALRMQDFDKRFFLAKLDSEGALVWKKQADVGLDVRSEVNYVETDEEGNIYVGGCFTNFSAQFGPHRIEAPVSPAYFVAKYDRDGNELWARHVPFPSVELHGAVKSLQVHKDQLYVVISDGDYNWSAPCDVRPFDIQLTVLDKEGNFINERRFTASDLSFVTDAKFSPSGYLHLIGMYRGAFEIDNRSLSAPCDEAKGFLIKLNPDLQAIDIIEIETPETYLQEIEFGENGTYYLSGRQVLDSVPGYDFNYFGNDRSKTFVKKYDKYDELIAERYFSKNHSQFYHSRPLIALDSEENIILSDRYRTAFDTFPSSGGSDMKLGLLKFSLDQPANYSTDEVVEVEEVLLFPNPATRELTLSSVDEDFRNTEFHIYDASGRWIASPAVYYDIGVVKVDLSKLASGVYFLQGTLGDRQFIKKFIKVN
jgi:ELWxxDGT repeat protein